jgi:hypothetical protein
MKEFMAHYGTWILAGIAIVAGIIWKLWANKMTKYGMQGDVNKTFGLPASWTPPEYLGPERGGDYSVKTLKGIKVFPHGFEREDIPLEKEGHKARVILSEIDDMWKRVRTEMIAGTYKNSNLLTQKQKDKVAKLADDLPIVDIWSTIQFLTKYGGYVGGIWDEARTISMAVWYKSALEGHAWQGCWIEYCYHEMGHLAFSSAGRPDLSEAIDGRV